MSMTVTELREDMAQFWASLKESERVREQERQQREQERQKWERVRERDRQESERVHREMRQAIKELSQEIKGGFGGIRNTIGHITEMVLLPGLITKINALGHLFTETSYRNEFKRTDGSILAEIDLLLQSGDEVMVVEAKTLFTGNDVKKLLECVQKLRSNEKLTGVVGKTIYAAAAGIEFTEESNRLIDENGIYSVEINEENDKIQVSPIPAGKVGKW